MDLTGTSLADVLPLEAPRWESADEAAPLDLLHQHTGFLSVEHSRQRMALRNVLAHEALDQEPEDSEVRAPHGVPFLNDFLLYATPDWDEEQDVPIESILWRMQGVPQESLRVIPSSALPLDLERTIPVVFDENHSGFLEGRLEYLLEALVPEQGEAVVVMDTPPTIPGLSRSVLSLALRLSREPKLHLSQDGFMPERLWKAQVEWTAFVVGSLDHQDVQAANRWLSLVTAEEERCIRFLFNRVPHSDVEQVQDRLREIVAGTPSRILDRATCIQENERLGFFRSSTGPSFPETALAFLGEE